MQTSEPGGSGLSVASNAAGPNTTSSESIQQDSKIEHQATQPPNATCTCVPNGILPTDSQDQTLNTNDGAVSMSTDQNLDIYESLRPSQSGISNPGEYGTKIEDLKKRLKQYEDQSIINNENAQKAENKLKDSKAQSRALRKELNKVKVQGQSHMVHHVTDSELFEKVGPLLYNISSIAIQCFEADPPTVELSNVEIIHDSVHPLKYLGMELDEFSDLMRSKSSRRIFIVQALIWATLCETLFGKFAWTGDRVAGAIMEIKNILHPDEDITPKEDRSQNLRRWHTWRASTSVVILEALAAEANAGQSKQAHLCERISKPLEGILTPFVGEEHDAFAPGLRAIVREAVDLDKVMNKQVPALTWIHKLKQLPEEYCSHEMEFESKNQSELSKKDDWLIVKPGLKRRGTSMGQNFDQVTILFKTTLIDKSIAVADSSEKWPANG